MRFGETPLGYDTGFYVGSIRSLFAVLGLVACDAVDASEARRQDLRNRASKRWPRSRT